MSLITIIDTETTGIDPTQHQIIEIAAILYSLTYAAPIESISFLIPCGDNPALAVNGIYPELTMLSEDMTMRLDSMEGRSIAYVAHNASFDESFLACRSYTAVCPKPEAQIPFVCSMCQIEWPVFCSTKSLVAIALAHGVGVASAHRAMADCDTLSRLFTRVHEMGHDLEEMIARAMLPRVKVRALVSYDKRQLAKDAGFQWDGENKRWCKEFIQGEVPELPFQTKPL